MTFIKHVPCQVPRTLLTQRSVIQILKLQPYLDPEIIKKKKKVDQFSCVLSLKKKKDLFSYPSQCKSLKHEISHFQRMYAPHTPHTEQQPSEQGFVSFSQGLEITAQRVCLIISNRAWNSVRSWMNSGGQHSFYCTALHCPASQTGCCPREGNAGQPPSQKPR